MPSQRQPVSGPGPAGSARPTGSTGPSVDDPVVCAASEVIGGPLGRHAAEPSPRPLPAGPVLVLAATAVLAAAVALRVPCRSTGWSSPGQFTHACYSEVAARVASGTVADQPPGAALLTAALARATSSASSPVTAAFDASVLLTGVALVVAVLALVLLTAARGRPWDAAALALSPVVLVSGLVSLELVAVAGVALGLLAWCRWRPAASGAALAAAAALDPLALVVLATTWAAALLARRAPAALASAAGAAALLAAVGVAWWITGLAGQALGDPGGPVATAAAVATAWVPGWGGQPGYGSVWLLPDLALPSGTDGPAGAGGGVLPGAVLRAGAVLALVVVGVGVAVLGRRWARATGPDALLAATPALALVAAVGVLVTSPTVPVQSALLFLPLVAASGLAWRDHLPWALVEAAAATTTWLYIYGQSETARGAEPWVYAVALIARSLALGWLALAAVRRVQQRAGARADGGAPVDDGGLPVPPPVVLAAAR